jgi:hypothetical protein
MRFHVTEQKRPPRGNCLDFGGVNNELRYRVVYHLIERRLIQEEPMCLKDSYAILLHTLM